MGIVDRNTVKSYFERGDQPTEAQFVDWIDSEVSHFPTIQDMLDSTPSGNVNDQVFIAKDFQSGLSGGGGPFYWDTSRDKADHNGIDVVDPNHSSSPAGAGWFSPENTGQGCYVRPSEDYYLASWAGFLPGATASQNGRALQAAVDLVQRNSSNYGRSVVMIPGSYDFDATITIHSRVELRSVGYGATKWNTIGESTVNLYYTGTSGNAIVVGGNADSANTLGGFNNAEGVRLRGFELQPKTTSTGHGIVIDGSSEFDGNRGYARDIELVDVTVHDFASGNGIYLLGNVFNTALNRPGATRNGNNVVAESGTVNTGVSRPGQINMYQPMIASVEDGGVNVRWIAGSIFGGQIEYAGNDNVTSVELYFNAHIYGTHIEGRNNGSCVGVKILGNSCSLYPKNLNNWDVGLQVGDGTSTQALGYSGHIPSLSSCNIGIQITDGGARTGNITYGSTSGVSTVVDDQRLNNDNINEFKNGYLPKQSNDIFILGEDEFIGFKNVLQDYEFGLGYESSSNSLKLKSRNAGGAITDRLQLDERQGTLIWQFLSSQLRFATESGATGARPSSPVVGQQYFDTTLGIPIWYDGTNWIDATGTTV